MEIEEQPADDLRAAYWAVGEHLMSVEGAPADMDLFPLMLFAVLLEAELARRGLPTPASPAAGL